jgi:formate dehydrogenase subunit gamma
MRFSTTGWRAPAAALAFAVLLVAAGPAPAQQPPTQQPASVNPTASSVREEQLLRELQNVQGRTSIPNPQAGVLIQPAGQDWRAFHQRTLPWVGALAILGMLAAVGVFYVRRGRIAIAGGPSGRSITRFSGLERAVHWLTAGCFIVLALSGLNITFGHALLAPLLGPDAFAALAQWGKYAHNFLAFPFMLGLVVMLAVWVKDNVPGAIDVAWLKGGGGLVGDGHPPAKRFNGGQKLIFWSVILGGAALSVTGLLLMFPFVGTTMAGMQLAQILHGLISVALIAIMIGHIYIGSLGMEGAFDAMGTGEVDLNWAKQHHSLWVAEAQSKGAGAPAGGAAAPAE